MVDKSVLESSAQVTLALPESGFSPDVISALSAVCSRYEDLSAAYLVLKKDGNDIILFFGFLFDDVAHAGIVERIMEGISEVFSGDVLFEGVCLNENKKLLDAVKSMTSPFYRKNAA